MDNLTKILGFKHNKPGFNHWWAQKITTILLILIGPWLLTLLLQDQPFSYGAAQIWFQNPWHSILSLIFILSLLLDFYLGMVTIVNDYIHENKAHKIIMLVLKGGTACMALGSLFIFDYAIRFVAL